MLGTERLTNGLLCLTKTAQIWHDLTVCSHCETSRNHHDVVQPPAAVAARAAAAPQIYLPEEPNPNNGALPPPNGNVADAAAAGP